MRRLINLVFAAITAYIHKEVRDYQTAALKMCAESDRTFRRYYYRMRDRINAWNSYLVLKQTALNIKVKENRHPAHIKKSIKYKWQLFNAYIQSYCKQLNEIKQNQYPLFGQWRYWHVMYLLNLNVTGLGP
jgi:hypothetical protein